ncbi:MaoC family dehydratase [Lipingzhangella sp. LS1_29]|uniref:MaoC family dehydratase n=1 Tax=Lipingzhangella rawalii TaxID=2055835 RepID=A0ABU2H417_9ACTN|nr:MaoC family dehydratase [Lipingzhangella rawalii]MDS1269570.1 MaoC family dehydratase [Lipingzhangella rawalii]
MRSFEDVTALLDATGETLGHSEWVEVAQDRIDTFANATEDHQWIHVDRERAAEGPFGTTIAHGFLTLSLLPALAAEVYHLEKAPSMGINYGLNKVRFLQPVTVGSRVRDNVVLTSAQQTERGILATMQHTVEIEGQERPALVAETLTLFVP